MGKGYDTLNKLVEFERRRSRKAVPLPEKYVELLDEEEPFFKTRGDEKYPVNPDELDLIRAHLQERDLEKARLPIFLKPAPSLGSHFYQILGVEKGTESEHIHSKIVFGILETKPRSYLHTYEVHRVKRIIPSLIHIFY